MKKYQKGSLNLSLLIIFVVVFIVTIAFSFYYLKYQKKEIPSGLPFIEVQATPTPEAAENSISTGKDIPTLEKELGETVIDSIDTELNDLKSSASSL